jgi:hypothetical protein
MRKSRLQEQCALKKKAGCDASQDSIHALPIRRSHARSSREERRKISPTKKYRQCGRRISQSGREASRMLTDDIRNESRHRARRVEPDRSAKQTGALASKIFSPIANLVSLTND